MAQLITALLAMLSWSSHVKHTASCKHMHTARALAPAIQRASERTGVHDWLIAAVSVVESGGRLGAVSSAGALGPMQILPHGRASRLCRKLNLYNKYDNVLCGAILLRDAEARCGGEPVNWLSAFNNYPCGETPYSRKILATMAKAMPLLAYVQ